MSVRILILGGGFAGAFTARHLLPFRRRHQLDIELINATNYFVFQPLLPEVASGTISAPDAVTPLRVMLPGVKVRMAEVKSVDRVNRKVRVVQGSKRVPIDIAYDHLVITSGQRTNLSLIPGMREHGLTLRDLADAHHLRNHVIQCLEHADVTTNKKLKQRLLTFVVAGGGFSGVETIGEMMEMIRRMSRFYPNVAVEEIKAILVQRGDRILPELPEKLGHYALRALQKNGIEVLLKKGIASVFSGSVLLDDDSRLETATVISTIGNEAGNLARSLGIPLVRGKLEVNPGLQLSGHEDVWAAGDVALVPLPATRQNGDSNADAQAQQYAPPTAQFAVRQARCLAQNLILSITGKPVRDFSYQPKGALASLGNYRGVADVMGIRIAGLPAWVLWRGFYIAMLPGFATRLRIALNWFFDYFLPRNTVQIKTDVDSGTRHIRVAAGDVLFDPGQIADGFYVVMEGALELRVAAGPEGGEDFVRLYRAGDHWGERLIHTDQYMPGRLLAVEDSRVLVLNGRDFISLRQSLPMLESYFNSLPEAHYAPSLRRS
ncbi:MAG: FAD-dependent oxidoreductase [Pseudomonadales bacterium]|nr:FAD-dependent oxidoreductase [Pseudomonadales bacterium]